MAKPCLSCQAILKQAGVRRIYYSCEDGEYHCM